MSLLGADARDRAAAAARAKIAADFARAGLPAPIFGLPPAPVAPVAPPAPVIVPDELDIPDYPQAPTIEPVDVSSSGTVAAVASPFVFSGNPNAPRVVYKSDLDFADATDTRTDARHARKGQGDEKSEPRQKKRVRKKAVAKKSSRKQVSREKKPVKKSRKAR